MYRMIKASSNKKYQCYYNETILVEQSDGSSREYIGKKVLTDSFDTEAEAEKYCRTHVGSQKVGNGYIENDMNYEEIEASTKISVKASDIAGSEYMLALVDDKNDKPLGYVTGYRRGGYYHPGDIIQCVYDEAQCDLIFDNLAKAKRRLAMYNHYSEVYMYDRTSRDYPLPSEKFRDKEVHTHLELVNMNMQ